jgi:hyperosmotically inducible protein
MAPAVLLSAVAAMSLVACQRMTEENASAPPASAAKTKVTANRPEPTAPATGNTVASRSVPRDVITDSMITARIKAGILSDPGMAGSDVSVNTDRGVVSLTGIIKSQEQAAIASAYAQRQDGVMRVDNALAVNLQ